ncbi:hypothetical protein P5673_033758 [Acropora cervicornis]|uniref:Uncharacterized protein n=1 Tax=Acropora cervicornis TaxID=6130 RepID=A0AAD9UQW1_ACRCE|nr:hypothetical protein P5673_033758 [Acropora cervicornis]
MLRILFGIEVKGEQESEICNASAILEVSECLLYPPSLTIPEECINVEDVAELLMRRDAPYIGQLLQSNHFSNAAGSRIITNLKPEVRDDVYCILYPEE